MTSYEISVAIDRLRPGARYSRYSTYAELAATWEEGQGEPPTQAELEAAYAEWEEEEASHKVFQQTIENGYLVEPEGFTLGLRDSDRANFAQLLTLVKLAEEMGMASNEYQVRAIDGQTHTVTRERLKQILLGYGAYYAGLYFST